MLNAAPNEMKRAALILGVIALGLHHAGCGNGKSDNRTSGGCSEDTVCQGGSCPKLPASLLSVDVTGVSQIANFDCPAFETTAVQDPTNISGIYSGMASERQVGLR